MAVLDEFKKFILRGNVVDLAVGVVIGTAFSKVVDSLVADVFMPVIGVVTGGVDVKNLKVRLYGEAYLAWGNFLQTVINFVLIGFCMFLVVKGINALHRYVLKEEVEQPAEATPPAERLLAEIRDLLKEQKERTSGAAGSAS